LSSRFRRNGQLILWSYTKHLGINEATCVGCNAKTRVPTLFCPRNSRSFEGVFKGFLHFFKVSLNIPNELRDSLNQSLNINWTGIAYYILSNLHVHVCLSTFKSLAHSLKSQCTEKKQTRNRKYTKQFKWQDQCRNKKIYCNEPQVSIKTYMYM
jgi:hypothetical protein